MDVILDAQVVAQWLQQDVLRNIVLLKHLKAFPDHTRATLALSELGHAALVLLDARASDYDRKGYPKASHIALISSTHPSPIEELLKIPKDSGVVFKLARDDDRDVICRRAFTCVLMVDGTPVAICLAYENDGRVWEVGGAIMLPLYRRRGFGSRIVRAALAEIDET